MRLRVPALAQAAAGATSGDDDDAEAGRGGIAEGGRTRPAIECAATLKEARGGHATSDIIKSLAVTEDDGTPC